MNVEFHEEAKIEIAEAASRYEGERPGLGIQFTREVERAVNRIIKAPLMLASVSKDIRRCPVHRFPYSILFSIEAEQLYLIAVMHNHRKPGYWTERLK